MGFMRLPILNIPVSQYPVSDRQEIFGVLFLRRFCEVEAARDHRLLVYNHNFIVGNGVPVIDQRSHPRMGHKVG